MSNDPTNPAHYQSNGIQVIDFIEAFDLNFRLGNVIKYLCRAGRKTPDKLLDYRKSLWYLNREIMKLEKEQEQSKTTLEAPSGGNG